MLGIFTFPTILLINYDHIINFYYYNDRLGLHFRFLSQHQRPNLIAFGSGYVHSTLP